MKQLQIDDICMAFEDVGGGTPIILVHGYPFNRTLWTDQLTALKETHRVITPDLRGFGDSDSSDGPATMDRMAQDISKLMDVLQIPKAVIGGLSMGGYVVLAFLKQFPSRVQALVLADTRPQGDTEEGKKIRAQQVEQILAEGMAGVTGAMLPKLLTPETVSRRPDIVKRVRDMMLKTKPAGAAAALQGMASREDHTEALSQINVPTLILVGREDPITPVSDSETMHNQISGSKLVVIEDASHVSNIEKAEIFNQELTTFLSSVN